jgi:hypothetical protein
VSATDDIDRRAHAELLTAAHALLAEHLEGPVAAEEWVQAVEHDPTIPRWYVRFGCEGRDAATIYFDLHQRSLHYELYFLPDITAGGPPERTLALFRYVLERNHTTYGAHFSLGSDGDIYLVGRCLLEHLDRAELDRIIGVLYEITERTFQTAIAIARG